MNNLQHIGVLSGLIGIPTSTLRFYDTQGITEPRKEACNQYRLYTPADSCRCLITKLLRSFGFSLENASKIVTENSLEASLEQMEAQEEILNAQFEELKEQLERLKDYKRTIYRCKGLENKVDISERKGFYRFSSIVGGKIIKSSQLKEFSSLWMQKLPFLSYSMKIDAEGNVSWGFSMEEEYLKSKKLTVPKDAEFFPPAKVLETCLLRKSASFLEPWEQSYIEDFRKQTSEHSKNPVLGQFLTIFYINYKPHYLYHLSCELE